jgi:hypothetical protein
VASARLDVAAVPEPRAAAVAPSLVFLPPLGTGVADPATFDATAAPVVEICPWNGTACTAAPVARFSTTPSGATLPLTVDAAAGRYEASWNLLDARFLTRQTYRIRVLQGTVVLGGVSVDVTRGRWALTRADGTLAPLAGATELPIRFGLNVVPVPNRPPVATITTPAPDAPFTEGQPVAFSGGATDPEDGALAGASLVWTSDRDGRIGTGTSFSTVTLSVGTHVVTLTATDSHGATGTATVRITVSRATPGPLTNGATVTGRIAVAHQVDQWTFTANQGDRVVVSLGETDNNATGFTPWLRVLDPSGTVVASNFGFFAAQVEFAAPAAGTYRVLVASADGGGVGTGDYRLTLIKAPGALTVTPGDEGGALTNGATHTGSIYTGDVDGWTFIANQGEHVVVSLGETDNSSGFSPWLRVVGPNGTVVGSNFGFFAAQVEFSAPTAGTYTVIVGSAAGGFTGTGGYLLTLIKAPGALTISPSDQGGPLANGATHSGNLYTGDVDPWTFSASQGDRVVISLGETANSSGLSPWLRVVDPTGVVVASNFGFFAAQVEFAAPTTGSYTVIVGSAAGGFTGTGDYLLTLVKGPGALTVSPGDQGGPLTNGATHTGSIYTGDVDGWTFTANQGDRVVVSLGETDNSSGLSPWLRVVGPNGAAIGSNFGFSAAQVEFAAPTTGTYTVVVGSAAGGFTGTGDYLLTLVKGPGALAVSPGDQGGAMTNGATHAGSIYLGDVDGWTFAANQGDRVVISLGETANSSGFSPWLRVVGPTGAVIGSNFGFSAAQVEFAAPAAGTYTVIVGSAAGGFTGTGDYLLTLVKGPGALAVSPGDQGGAMTNGATHPGSIYLGDVDGWTFTANQGDRVVVSLGETDNSSGLSPWLRIVSPTGASVGSNFGFSAAQVEFAAPATGTYTVIVGSAGGGFTGTGDYLLTLIRAPGALTVSPGDQGGGITSGSTRTGSIYLGDIDGWTLTATQGERVVVGLSETANSSGFSPWLRVVSPTGAVVGSNFGFSAAQVAFNAPTTGTYTVIVGSAGGGFTGTGDYLLTLSVGPLVPFATRVGLVDVVRSPGDVGAPAVAHRPNTPRPTAAERRAERWRGP